MTKKQMEERKQRGDRIRVTMQSSGWKDIELIFQEELRENLDKILKEENPEARASVNTINRVMEKINDNLEWGEAALEQYRKRFQTKLSNGE